jgi:hypothetical protein
MSQSPFQSDNMPRQQLYIQSPLILLSLSNANFWAKIGAGDLSLPDAVNDTGPKHDLLVECLFTH